jgi:hypothetical protein
MSLRGPDVYRIAFDSNGYKVANTLGGDSFTGRAAAKCHKLYAVAIDGLPAYVGITRQRLSARLRLGWKAQGESGYYGYAWRHNPGTGALHVWHLHDDGLPDAARYLETVEAEVVYLIRQAGQWPTHQTEIHFWPSSAEHRAAATLVYQALVTAAS